MAKIHEVAKAAGVSISTVSYALSGKRPVSLATRRRIERAVLELDYRPNAGARMLAGSRTHIFALTEPFRADTHAPTHMAFVLATSIAARTHDYDILLLTDEQAIAGMRRVASSGLVDGVIVLDVAPDDARVELARHLSIPSVFIGVPNHSEGLICVDLDFEAAAALAVDRLADGGHTSLGLVGQAQTAYEVSNFPPRVRTAFEAGVAARGLEPMFRTSGGSRTTAEDARRGAEELLDAGVTGLVLHCNEDAHAAVLAGLAGRGLTIGTDVAVVSVAATFDTSAFSTPVDVIPLLPQASADLAVGLAMRCLGDNPPAPGIHLIPPIYIDHGSVSALGRSSAASRTGGAPAA
ncbi:LacI family DNA-binding transcriptional regulator [Microbacterium sp. DT81.1]|uniref:LacI family DNA-binding transcriptional regulator n=1 Tax=Microbacterium sp. DT81.1 TaxID=3393413 RepID=UPI003CE960D1